MRKILFVIVLAIIGGIPFASTLSTLTVINRKQVEKIQQSESPKILRTDNPTPADTPSKWANGNFSGIWELDI